MGYPLNPEMLQGIYKKSFFDGASYGAATRIYSRVCKDVPQDSTTVTYTSFGSVPEPRQKSGNLAGGVRQAKELKDWKLTVNVEEYEVTIDMPRSVAEDNPADAQGMVNRLGMKCDFAYDRQFFGVLTSTTLLGYDGVVVYSSAHPESGTNQDNTGTSAGTPNAAQVETGLTDSVGKILAFVDDQGTPVNEGVTQFVVLVNPLQYYTYKAVLDPTMSNQAVDSSGGTGVFRGTFNVIATRLVTTKTHYVFAVGGNPAVGFFHKTAWDLRTNMYTESDAWNHADTAMFTGYARHSFYPWDWKSTARYVFT